MATANLGIPTLTRDHGSRFARINAGFRALAGSIAGYTTQVQTGDDNTLLENFAHNSLFDVVGAFDTTGLFIGTVHTIDIPAGIKKDFWIRNSTTGHNLGSVVGGAGISFPLKCQIEGNVGVDIALVRGYWNHLYTDGSNVRSIGIEGMSEITGVAHPANGTLYANSEVMLRIPLPDCTLMSRLPGAEFTFETPNAVAEGDWTLVLLHQSETGAALNTIGNRIFEETETTPKITFVAHMDDVNVNAGEQFVLRADSLATTNSLSANILGYRIPILLR